MKERIGLESRYKLHVCDGTEFIIDIISGQRGKVCACVCVELSMVLRLQTDVFGRNKI